MSPLSALINGTLIKGLPVSLAFPLSYSCHAEPWRADTYVGSNINARAVRDERNRDGVGE